MRFEKKANLKISMIILILVLTIIGAAIRFNLSNTVKDVGKDYVKSTFEDAKLESKMEDSCYLRDITIEKKDGVELICHDQKNNLVQANIINNGSRNITKIEFLVIGTENILKEELDKNISLMEKANLEVSFSPETYGDILSVIITPIATKNGQEPRTCTDSELVREDIKLC